MQDLKKRFVARLLKVQELRIGYKEFSICSMQHLSRCNALDI